MVVPESRIFNYAIVVVSSVINFSSRICGVQKLDLEIDKKQTGDLLEIVKHVKENTDTPNINTLCLQ